MPFESIIWFVIINPTSGNGRGLKKWPKIKHTLELNNFNFKYAFTKHHGHAKELTQKAIADQITNIISVGGDGTLHHVINGIMTQNTIPSKDIKIGVIPIGTGNDWVKTYGIPKNPLEAIKIIKNGTLKCQDLGKITYLNNCKSVFYFNNLAGIGFDGLVVSKVSKYKKFGTIAYIMGAIFSLFSFQNFKSRVIINSNENKYNTFMILIGLCKFSGGGMQLTSSVNPFDGLFDISIVNNVRKIDIIKNLKKLFNGKINTIKKVESHKSNAIEIYIEQGEMPYIQADGELIGKNHVKLELIPNAFTFYC